MKKVGNRAEQKEIQYIRDYNKVKKKRHEKGIIEQNTTEEKRIENNMREDTKEQKETEYRRKEGNPEDNTVQQE